MARLKLPLYLAPGIILLVGCSTMHCGDGCREYGSPYAGMKYDCDCESCGPNCGPSCGEYACGCAEEYECGCAEESSCACECGDNCGGKCRQSRSRWSGLFGNGCNGCGEMYWSEWHNDPPVCCEPCDCFGNYTGAHETGYYQAPYLHASAYAEHAPAELPPLEVAPTEPPATPEPSLSDDSGDLVNPLTDQAE
jgi:hypothetical protein